MNVRYGVWSPKSKKLPDIKGLDFAAFYITDSGEFNKIQYKSGLWLIYICEARGTLSESNFWRISDGIILFNADSHTNVPNAGFYTKVRLDNSGNIVAGSDIEYDDLPEEAKQKFNQISDANINKLISKQLETAFTNSALSPVQFRFDKKTGKISASLSLDEETVNLNKFGQLVALSGGSIEIDTKSLDDLKKTVKDIQAAVVKIKPVKGQGINVTVDKGGSIISANIDENSIKFNANGQLSVNPDILSEYLNGGGEGNCANHEHSAAQIKDLSKYVNTVINNSSITNVLKSNIENLVDEVTIRINSNGKLEAIATHVQKHQHTMDDVTDLNQEIANVWASNQRLHASNENQNFDAGAVVMSSLTIGEVLIAFNELLKEQQRSIRDTASKLGTIEPVEPGLINAATFVDMSETIEAIDVTTMKTVNVTMSPVVGTTDVIFYNGSKIHAYVDGNLVDTLNAYDSDDVSFSSGEYDNFTVTYYGDAYPKFKTFQGYYKGFSFTYTPKNLEEGEHKIQFVQENINTKVKIKSDVITVKTYQDFAPTGRISIIRQPENDSYVSGIRCSKDENPEVEFQVIAKSFTSRYTPMVTNIATVLGKTYSLELQQVINGMMSYKPITVKISGEMNVLDISALIFNFAKRSREIKGKTSYMHIDTSSEEDFRWVQLGGALLPSDNSITTYSKYNAADPLLNEKSSEMQVINHSAIVAQEDFTKMGIGPDYSSKAKSQMITLRFDSPKISNFYFDLTDDNGKDLTYKKDGTINGLYIFASLAPSNVVTRWVDCNTPYAGFGCWKDGKIFNGLDLFRTEKSRRFITFGKDAKVDGGYLYLKIVSNGAKINLSRLISSIGESLNERK